MNGGFGWMEQAHDTTMLPERPDPGTTALHLFLPPSTQTPPNQFQQYALNIPHTDTIRLDSQNHEPGDEGPSYPATVYLTPGTQKPKTWEDYYLGAPGRRYQYIKSRKITKSQRFVDVWVKRKVIWQRTQLCHRSGHRAPKNSASRETKKSANCQCKRVMVRYQDEPNRVYMYQIGQHTGHVPGSSEDIRFQPLPEHVAELIEQHIGQSTTLQILTLLQSNKFIEGKISREEAERVTKSHIDNIRKNWLSKIKLDPNDMAAVELLIAKLDFPLLYRHKSPENSPQESYRVAVCSPFQQQMIRDNRRLLFLDAVCGLNQYGYVQLTMVVMDQFRHAFPVAFCISNTETAEVWAEFIEKILKKCNIPIDEVTFMIDKSTACIAAINRLQGKYLLCSFHMDQDFDRFMKKTISGISGKENAGLRHRIHKEIQTLQNTTQVHSFTMRSNKFKDWLSQRQLDSIKQYYEINWEDDADHWAGYARSDVSDLRHSTNNLIERFFNTQKYSVARGRKYGRIEFHLVALVDVIIPFYYNRFRRRASGAEKTKAGIDDSKYEKAVKSILSSKQKIMIEDEELMILTCPSPECFPEHGSDMVNLYTLSCGDLSCSCQANELDICMHIEACMIIQPLSAHLMIETAKKIAETDYMFTPLGDDSDLVFECLPAIYLSDEMSRSIGNEKHIEKYIVNLGSETCTCHCYQHFEVCPHLIAKLGIDTYDVESMLQSTGKITDVVRKPRNQRPIEGFQRFADEGTARFGNGSITNPDRCNQPELNGIIGGIRRLEPLVMKLNPSNWPVVAGMISEIISFAEQNAQDFQKTRVSEKVTQNRRLKRNDAQRKHHTLFEGKTISQWQSRGVITKELAFPKAKVAGRKKRKQANKFSQTN